MCVGMQYVCTSASYYIHVYICAFICVCMLICVYMCLLL